MAITARVVQAVDEKPANPPEEWVVEIVKALPVAKGIGERPAVHVAAETGWLPLTLDKSTAIDAHDLQITATLRPQDAAFEINLTLEAGKARGEMHLSIDQKPGSHKALKLTNGGVYLVVQVCVAPSDKPANVTGTIGTHDDPKVTLALGHHGVLFIRSEARWKELQERLGEAMAFTPDTPLPKIDVAKQNIVMVYADARRPKDDWGVGKSDLSATPPELSVVLHWDGSPVEHAEKSTTPFLLTIIPATPNVQVRVWSSPLGMADRPATMEFSTTLGGKDGENADGLNWIPIGNGFSATLGNKEGGDIVDGLQAAITPKAATVKPGEDILIDLALQLADASAAKPEQFGTTPKSIFVCIGIPADRRRPRRS
jgi:hypothetical protein